MAERLNQIPEREINTAELAARAQEQREKLRENLENNVEKSPEVNVEKARHEALETAKTIEKADSKQKEKEAASPAEKRGSRTRNKSTLDASFNSQMKEVRSEMSAPSRAFSKVIHNKAIEKTSEVVGSTIARPNAMLSGALFALIVTASIYFWTRWAGYPLSGFEAIGSFIIGYLLGIIFDFTRIMITGKR